MPGQEAQRKLYLKVAWVLYANQSVRLMLKDIIIDLRMPLPSAATAALSGR